MKPNEVELWLSIPETDHRFEVSNFGHVRQMARNTRRGRSTIRIQAVKPRPLVSDFSSGVLGWSIFFDNANHFFPRDDLMAMFPEAVLDIDCSADADCIAARDAALRDYEERHGEPYSPAYRPKIGG